MAKFILNNLAWVDSLGQTSLCAGGRMGKGGLWALESDSPVGFPSLWALESDSPVGFPSLWATSPDPGKHTCAPSEGTTGTLASMQTPPQGLLLALARVQRALC